jgi:succinate dehydrogenase / fumarate reductase iron-sulfur subunit
MSSPDSTGASMHITLKIWRQPTSSAPGELRTYHVKDVSPDMSFLEMLDVLNEDLMSAGEEPVAFEHDCREGICGSCGFMINGQAHGPDSETTVCQLHMRRFADGDALVLEPWRARAFPVLRDLIVERSAFDRIMAAGGYVSVNAGSAPDANAVLVPKVAADQAMDAAACIGCGACVAACPNAAAMLFTGAKVSQLALLPQGQPERERRVLAMVEQMDAEGFGNCSNHYECEAACPKAISVEVIARMNRDRLRAQACGSGSSAE